MRHWTQAFWSKLSPLVDRALELDPGERRALLAEVRAGDEELAGALEQLVVEHDRVMASDFLESPLAVAAPPSLAGQVVGAYTLENPIGSGGMGTVWLARRSDGRFEGRVAIKFINLAVFDRVGQERFRREGTLLARLSHPNIARLHDAGVTASGQPFLVLEYVEGLRIDDHAAERRLGVDARLELFLQVADAVAHAHSNLVVHRDLKPSNVLVDRDGQVKLLDFGIATLVDSSSAPSATGTLAALTPEYAAPEQLTGAAMTTATDVYSLGVLLFQMLVGSHPTAPRDATHAAALRALAEQEAMRLSDAAARLGAFADRVAAARDTTPTRLRRACRGDLDTILAKALKKAAAERYQTVTAFADDIRRYLRREPVTARPDSVWYRTRRFVARHRLEVAAAATAALALVLGTGIAVRQARVSALERNRALEELRRAEATNDFSSFLLSAATPSDKPVTNADLLARGQELIDRRFAADPLLRVHLQLVLADRHYENFQYDQWRQDLARAFEQSRTLPDVRLRSMVGCRMATALAERGDYGRASTLIAEALADLRTEPDAVAEQAACFLARSVAFNMQGDASHAIEAGETSLRLEHQRQGPPGSDAEELAALALAYSTADRYADSDRAFAALMRSFEAQGREETRSAAIVLNNWAVALEAGGQLRRAAAQVQRVGELVRHIDAEHGASPAQLRTYGSILSTVGLHDAAVAAVEEAVSKARSGGLPLGLFWALGIASRVYGEAGRLDAADTTLRELQSLAASQPDLPVRERAAVDRFAALAALRRGQAEPAIALASRALARLETGGRPDREKLPLVTILASAYNAAGRFELAGTTAERARQMAVSHLGQFDHSYQMGAALLELGIADAGLQRVEDARAALRQAVAHLRDALGDDAPDARRAVARLAAAGG